jgi:pyruvate dehydrogenase E2 component (dihydrolipoamide acetyltransferase)
MGDFTMPSLGADMEVGTVLEWRVRPGDTVHRGDIVAVVDTEKSTIDVEIFEDGVIAEILVPPGREVAVGTPLARVTAAAEAIPPAKRKSGTKAGAPSKRKARAKAGAPTKPKAGAAAEAPVRARAPTPPEKPAGARRRAPRRPAAPVATTGRVRSSPLARRRAAEQGLDLATLTGSGPDGAVLATDVDRTGTGTPRGAAAPAAPATPAGTVAPAPAGRRATAEQREAMRHAIAALMARSKREIPHYYLATTIDLAATRRWLTEANLRRPVADRLLPSVLLLKATALAARQVPDLNGFWDGGFRASPAVHLGVAVALRGGGLIAPAIHDADRLGLDELMRGLRDLVQRARAGSLRSSEMADPTLTVTNLGDQGVDEVHGVIYPPQVALVGFGKIAERPWAVDGMLGVRPVVRATLAADHRASDGHVGARFLATIDRLLQTPEDL